MQLVGTVIMARLLTPEEVGTFAIAAVFVSVASSIRHLNLLAPFAASFYGQPEVASVMHALSTTFFVTPFAAVTLSIFRRELRMGPTFFVNASSNLVVLVMGILLAIKGFGALSLAWANVAGAWVAVAIALWFKPHDVPMWRTLAGCTCSAR
jgi:O-antigen/teichoic acid export membrane protein